MNNDQRVSLSILSSNVVVVVAAAAAAAAAAADDDDDDDDDDDIVYYRPHSVDERQHLVFPDRVKHLLFLRQRPWFVRSITFPVNLETLMIGKLSSKVIDWTKLPRTVHTIYFSVGMKPSTILGIILGIVKTPNHQLRRVSVPAAVRKAMCSEPSLSHITFLLHFRDLLTTDLLPSSRFCELDYALHMSGSRRKDFHFMRRIASIDTWTNSECITFFEFIAVTNTSGFEHNAFLALSMLYKRGDYATFIKLMNIVIMSNSMNPSEGFEKWNIPVICLFFQSLPLLRDLYPDAEFQWWTNWFSVSKHRCCNDYDQTHRYELLHSMCSIVTPANAAFALRFAKSISQVRESSKCAEMLVERFKDEPNMDHSVALLVFYLAEDDDELSPALYQRILSFLASCPLEMIVENARTPGRHFIEYLISRCRHKSYSHRHLSEQDLTLLCTCLGRIPTNDLTIMLETTNVDGLMRFLRSHAKILISASPESKSLVGIIDSHYQCRSTDKTVQRCFRIERRQWKQAIVEIFGAQ